MKFSNILFLLLETNVKKKKHKIQLNPSSKILQMLEPYDSMVLK